MNWRLHWIPATEWLLIVLLAVALAIPFSTPENPLHLRQADYVYYYYPAGERLMHGQSPYGFNTKWGDTNPMPPWFTLLIAPLSLLPQTSAAWCWLALNLGMLVGIVVLATRLSGTHPGVRRTLLAAAALSFWRPVSSHLFLGQSAILVTLAATGALFAADRGRLWLAGILMVASSSKPHLAFLLGLGLTIFGWRTRRSLAVPFGFAIALGAALLTCLAITTAWVGDLIHKPPGVYDYWGITLNLRALLGLAFDQNPLSEILYWIIFAAGIGLVLRLWAKADRPLAELGALTLAATLLLTPYAQSHDYVLLIPALVLLAARACAQPPPRRRAWLLAALVLACWILGSLHKWLLTLVETGFVWKRLEPRLGEAAMDTLWQWLKHSARFFQMLMPAGIVFVLIHSWKTRDSMAAESPTQG